MASGRSVDQDSLLWPGTCLGALFLKILDADLAGAAGPRRSGIRCPNPMTCARAVWRRVGIDDDSAVVVYDSKGLLDRRPGLVALLTSWSEALTDVRVLDGGVRCLVGRRPPGPGRDRPWVSTATARFGDGRAPGACRPWTPTPRPPNWRPGRARPARRACRGPLPRRGRAARSDRRAHPGRGQPAADRPADVADGTFREPGRDLATAFAALPDGDVAASCGSGVTACHLILAGAGVGREIALYPGSYSGWLALGRPVAVGPEPGAATLGG